MNGRATAQAVRALEDLGVITVTHSRGAPNTYHWNYVAVQNMIDRSRR